MTASARLRLVAIVLILSVGRGTAALGAQDSASVRPTMRADGTTPVPAYNLPVSKFLTPETRKTFIQGNLDSDRLFKGCTTTADTEKGAVALRRCIAPMFAQSIAKMKARYQLLRQRLGQTFSWTRWGAVKLRRVSG